MCKIEKAIDVIDKQSEKLDDNAKIIAQYIIDNLITDETAKIFVDNSKTLKGCLDLVKSNARKQAINNVAMVSDTVVYGWVCEYYGVKQKEQKTEQKSVLQSTAPEPTQNNDIIDLLSIL